MKTRLNTRSASLVVLFYLMISIVAALFAAIFFGGSSASEGDRNIDGVIDDSMIGTLIVTFILLLISLFVFKDSRRDIFFERKRFALSRRYYLFPMTWLTVTVIAFFNVDYSTYSLGVLSLVLLATLSIGLNEEIVTRGILLVGLRNSGLAEWKAWLLTLVAFSLMHLVNLVGGGSPMVLLVVLTGGTLLYVSRRVFNNLFVPIALHALYDAAFFLLSGQYLIGQSLPDKVLDLQLASFLVLFIVSVSFLIFGRELLKSETTGWEPLPQIQLQEPQDFQST